MSGRLTFSGRCQAYGSALPLQQVRGCRDTRGFYPLLGRGEVVLSSPLCCVRVCVFGHSFGSYACLCVCRNHAGLVDS